MSEIEQSSQTFLEAHRPRGKCPECGSERLIRDYKASEIVCIDCGFVVVERIADFEQEWRSFEISQATKKSRVGMPLTYAIHDKGLSTIIDSKNKDAAKKKPHNRAKHSIR